MEQYRIRLVRSRDLNQIVELNRRAELSEWQRKDYARAIVSDRFVFRVVESTADGDGGVSGFALGAIVGEGIELLKLAVDPPKQRRGLGRMLLEEMLSTARKRGCKRCLLEVSADNAPAIGLYNEYRFSVIDRRRDYYSPPLQDALVMECYLEEDVRPSNLEGRIP